MVPPDLQRAAPTYTCERSEPLAMVVSSLPRLVRPMAGARCAPMLSSRPGGVNQTMSTLHLTLACGDYDRMRALHTGAVKPKGVELNVLSLEPEEMFYRMARFREFDVSELSLSTYTVLRARGEPLIAIPVFPSSMFRHSSIFVRDDGGVKEPKDLVGKRMGIPKYHMTAAVWIRGMLEDEYGVAPRDMLWFEGGEGSLVKEVDVTLPADVPHQLVPDGKNLGE